MFENCATQVHYLCALFRRSTTVFVLNETHLKITN